MITRRKEISDEKHEGNASGLHARATDSATVVVLSLVCGELRAYFQRPPLFAITRTSDIGQPPNGGLPEK